jgi:Na+/melibiose symporter-like transporter
MTSSPSKLDHRQLLLIGLGPFSVSMLWGAYNRFVPVFLDERFLLGPGLLGVFMTLDNIVALLIQAPVGAWSDRLRTPLGRRLPFILVGAPIAALAFALVPLADRLPVFVASTMTVMVAMALWRVPFMALMPDLTPSPLRSRANGVLSLMQGLSGVLAALGGAALYDVDPAYPFWFAGAVVVVAALLAGSFIREPATPVRQAGRPGIWATLGTVARTPDRSLRRLLLAIFTWSLALNVLDTFFSLYAIDHLGLSAAGGARLFGQFGLVWILMSLPAGIAGSRFGRRRTVMAGLSVFSAALLGLYLAPAAVLTIPLGHAPAVGTLCVVSLALVAAAVGFALLFVQALPMMVDLTDATQSGTYTGLYYVAVTLAGVVGPSVLGWVIEAAGSDYNLIMLAAPLCTLVALALVRGVERGEAVTAPDAGARPEARRATMRG